MLPLFFLWKEFEMNIYITLVILILVVIIGLGFNCYIEYKQYNHGKRRWCNGELSLFYYDSQGGRLYKCNKCRSSVRISWPVD